MSEDVYNEIIISPNEFYDFYGTYSFGKIKPCFLKAIYVSKEVQILMFKLGNKTVLMKRFTISENYKSDLFNEFHTIGNFSEYKIITLIKLDLKVVEIIFVEDGIPLSEVCGINVENTVYNPSTLDIASKLLHSILYYEFHKIPVTNLSIESFFYFIKEGISQIRFLNLNIPSENCHLSSLWVNLVLKCKKLNSIDELSPKEIENNQDLTKKFYIILKHSLEKPIQIKLLIEIMNSISQESFESIDGKLKVGKNTKESLYKKIDSLNVNLEQHKKQYEFLVKEYLKFQTEIDKSNKKISTYLPKHKIYSITEIVDFLLSRIIELEGNNKDKEKQNKEFIEMNFKIQKNSIEYLSEKLDNSQSIIDGLNQSIFKMKREVQEYEKIKETLIKESKFINNSCLLSLNELIKTVNEFDKNLIEAQNKANESISKYLDEKQLRNEEILKISRIIAESNKVLNKLKIESIISSLDTLPQAINEIYESIIGASGNFEKRKSGSYLKSELNMQTSREAILIKFNIMGELKNALSCVTRFDFTRFSLRTNEILAISQIIKYDKSINCFYFSTDTIEESSNFKEISRNDTEILSEGLSERTEIKEFKFGKGLNNEKLILILNGIRQSTNVEFLELGGEDLTDRITQELSKYVSLLHNLKYFSFNSQKVTNQFLSEIASSLINKEKLNGIEFYCNLIGDIGIKNFIHEFKKIKTINHLIFFGCNIKYQGVFEIASYLETLPQLIHFGLCSKEAGDPESMLLMKPLSMHSELEYSYIAFKQMTQECQKNVSTILSTSNPQTKLFFEMLK